MPSFRCRFEDVDAIHTLWNRGVEKRMIFLDDDDRSRYLGLLGETCKTWEWDCLEYCLMGNHIHIVVRTREPTLSRGMHRLHTFYVAHFNGKYDRVGPLFQSRFGSARIWTPERFDDAIDYVAQNPVTAGLCEKPVEWPWGSASARTNGGCPSWLAPAERVAWIRTETFG